MAESLMPICEHFDNRQGSELVFRSVTDILENHIQQMVEAV